MAQYGQKNPTERVQIDSVLSNQDEVKKLSD
jgi:hypothetical protein